MPDSWDDVGVEAAWQALDLATGRSLGEFTSSELPIASVAKVAVVLALLRKADRGDLDPTRMVTVHSDGRSRGTTGISAMSDAVTLSLRDAAYLSLTISDNAAADALWDAMGGEVQAELDSLDLGGIHVREPMRDLYDRLARSGTLEGPKATTASPRALVRMLSLIWTDQAASPQSCAFIRDLMHRQVWGFRLASGFPAIDITVAGKTGTIGDYRHEIGVVTYPGDRAYAVAFLTHSMVAEPDHRVDQAIGRAARAAILRLRRGSG